MDQDKLAQMLSNPMLQLSLSMMGSPAGTSLPNAIARGAGVAYTGMRNQYDYERQLAEDERRKAEDEQKMAARASLSGALKNMPLPPVDDTSPEGQFRASLRDLYETDPEKAMELVRYAAQNRLITMPAEPEKFGPKPWHVQDLDPGSDEYKKAESIARGTALSASGEESLRLREESQRLREQQFALAQDRFRASQADAGGGPAGTPAGLGKAQTARRAEITAARQAVNKLFAARVDAESFAKNNPGFKKTLDLANERMPGDDPAWEKTMGTRAKNASRPAADPVQARYDAAYKRALDKGDTRAAKRIQNEAAAINIKVGTP